MTYTYLYDATKVSALKSDGSGKRYLGSAVYSVPESDGGSETFESAAWDEGRIFFDVEEAVDSTGNGLVVVDSIPGIGCYRDCWYVTDHLGNVRSIVDISASLAAPQVVERNDYLPFGTRLGVGTGTGTGTGAGTGSGDTVLEVNRYRLGGKEEQSFGGLDLGKVDFGARMYDPFTARWTTIDPMADKYASMSPYSYCAGNPISIIDLDGQSYSEFDENGNYLHTINDTWWHNLWHGRKGRIVDGDGNIISSFRFADPENDIAELKNGTITKIQFVQENEILSMLSKAGAFNEENKVENTESRYGFIMREGKGGGKFDFSYTGIHNQFPEASTDPLRKPSPMLFLVDGVAHNHMNFGNFLFGAAGKALGLNSFELKMGAQLNSLINSSSNGYRSQFDSRDDQFSIKMGVRHARRHGYKSMTYGVAAGSLTIKGFSF